MPRQGAFTIGCDDVYEGEGVLLDDVAVPLDGQTAVPVSMEAVPNTSTSRWSRHEALCQLKLALQVDVPMRVFPAADGHLTSSVNCSDPGHRRCSVALRRTRSLAELKAHCEALCAFVSVEKEVEPLPLVHRKAQPLLTLPPSRIEKTQVMMQLLTSSANGEAATQELSDKVRAVEAEIEIWRSHGKTELANILHEGPGAPFRTAGDHDDDAMEASLRELGTFTQQVLATNRLSMQANDLLWRYQCWSPLVDAATNTLEDIETTQALTSNSTLRALEDLQRCIEAMSTVVEKSVDSVRANRTALEGAFTT